MASSGPAPTGPCPPCAGDPRAGRSAPGGSQQSRAEGENPLPQPAGHAAGDAAQDTVGFLSCERTLLAHIVCMHVRVCVQVCGGVSACAHPCLCMPVHIVAWRWCMCLPMPGVCMPVHVWVCAHAYVHGSSACAHPCLYMCTHVPAWVWAHVCARQRCICSPMPELRMPMHAWMCAHIFAWPRCVCAPMPSMCVPLPVWVMHMYVHSGGACAHACPCTHMRMEVVRVLSHAWDVHACACVPVFTHTGVAAVHVLAHAHACACP